MVSNATLACIFIDAGLDKYLPAALPPTQLAKVTAYKNELQRERALQTVQFWMKCDPPKVRNI